MCQTDTLNIFNLHNVIYQLLYLNKYGKKRGNIYFENFIKAHCLDKLPLK